MKLAKCQKLNYRLIVITVKVPDCVCVCVCMCRSMIVCVNSQTDCKMYIAIAQNSQANLEEKEQNRRLTLEHYQALL